MKHLLPLLLLVSTACAGQTFTYKGYRLKLIHPIKETIYFDTIIFNQAHDTAFILRKNVGTDIILADSILTLDVSDAYLDIDRPVHIKHRYDNYLNYKKYKGYYRAKSYVHPASYFSGDYSGIHRPVNLRVFRYEWAYKSDTEEASGTNYITQAKAPTNKQVRALIYQTCKRKNVTFNIEEL